ncbi:MAG: ABC transporter ATP-binding protein [Clostridia bacterium]|nr:ABC transporter ATP-binding protein [Clostridia bacterium]
MIQMEHISKIYQVGDAPFYALRDVSLHIGAGEMVAVRGRSGAGKSTLLHIIGGLDTPDEGRYMLNGLNVGEATDAGLARIRNEQIGFVLQDFSLIDHRSTLYNVTVPMLFGKTPFSQMKTKALDALEAVGVSDQAHKAVSDMSGGQRQRVAIARALVNDPPVILADEPTGNLDSETTEEIMKLFVSLHERGKTVVIVTHDEHVASFCDRSITISDGKII